MSFRMFNQNSKKPLRLCIWSIVVAMLWWWHVHYCRNLFSRNELHIYARNGKSFGCVSRDQIPSNVIWYLPTPHAQQSGIIARDWLFSDTPTKSYKTDHIYGQWRDNLLFPDANLTVISSSLSLIQGSYSFWKFKFHDFPWPKKVQFHDLSDDSWKRTHQKQIWKFQRTT